MNDRREDRRVRRTRRLLHEALRSLIVEKGFERVRVQDILTRADISRAAFYAHFSDKGALLRHGLDEMRAALRQQLTGPSGVSSRPNLDLQFFRALFVHAEAHRREYRAPMGGHGTLLAHVRDELTSLLRAHVEDAVARRRLTPAAPPDVLTHYAVSALVGVLAWWLDNDRPYPAERIAQVCDRLTRSVLAAGLGTSA